MTSYSIKILEREKETLKKEYQRILSINKKEKALVKLNETIKEVNQSIDTLKSLSLYNE